SAHSTAGARLTNLVTRDKYARGIRTRARLLRVAHEPCGARVLPGGPGEPAGTSRPLVAQSGRREGRGRRRAGGAAPGGEALPGAWRTGVDPAEPGHPPGASRRGDPARPTARRAG